MSADIRVHFCRGPEMVEVRREPDGLPRWCFTCRKHRDFFYVVDAPAELSYYGPNPSIRCSSDHVDGDLFPGNSREWEG